MHAHLILQPEVQVQVRARMMLDMLLHAIVFMSHVQSCSQAHSRGQQLVADMQPDPLTERQEAELLEHPIQDQDVQQRLGRASFKTFMFTSMLLPLLFLVLAAWVKANAPSISALGVDQVPGLEEAEDTSPLGISDWARKQLIADMRRELAGMDYVAA